MYEVRQLSESLVLRSLGLLVVGIVGALLSLIFWSSWAGPGYFTRRERVIDDRY